MSPRIPTFAVVVALATLGATATAHAAERYAGKVVMFGNLHAHSAHTDDVGGTLRSDPKMQPPQAWKTAQDGGLDFLAITDHHKAVDSPGRSYLDAQEYERELYQAAVSYNAGAAGKFVAIPGIEWGNTKTGNHVNVFGAKILPPDSIVDAAYDQLFAWTRDNAEFIQFNHPHSWQGDSGRNKTVGNFGEALYETQAKFVDAVDASVECISIICSVRGGHITGRDRRSTEKVHRDMQWENYYRRYLNKGFHISPSANQDTHSTNFGVVTAARTAVWARDVSYDALMEGFRDNRVYATEDDELVVAWQVVYGGRIYWMGSAVPLQQDEVDVELRIKIWQAAGVDGDPTGEGPYTVAIVSDPDGRGGNEASVWDTYTIADGQEYRVDIPVVAGEYFYLQVTEQNGKDNLVGEGDDADGDGNRDDPNDQAWTAPVWFKRASATPPAPAPYVWSKGSNVYHDANCYVVPRIGIANRRSGDDPGNRRKHDCKPRTP